MTGMRAGVCHVTMLAAITLAALAMPAPAAAHPLAPVGLELCEGEGGRVEARFKRALVQPVGARLRPRWPASCVVEESAVATSDDAVTETVRLHCSGGLAGQRVGVEGLEESGVDAVIRVEVLGGHVHRALLHGDDEPFLVPEAPHRGQVIAAFARLGVEHLLTGLDHLLFVFALWLLVRRGRALVLAITAFTVGHSFTLTAATLGWLSLSPAYTEPAIALSLLVMAAHVAARARAADLGEATTPRRGGRLWLMAGAFGLLHGLGFAGALADAGLPAGEIPLALASFNAGIELAQLAVVAALSSAAWATQTSLVHLSATARLRAPGYAIGALAAMWLIERLAALA
jgi:hydrogenase/urease accessory protein HupE